MKHYVVVTFQFQLQLLLLLLFSPALWGDGKGALGFLSPQLDLFSPSPSLALADLYDPFRILEHIPLSLEKDDATLPAALVDWKETPDGHLILIDVPGMKKDDLKIEVEENRVLRVSGERKQEENLLREDDNKKKKKKEDHWHRVERTSYGRFWRQFRLPDNVDLDSIEAKLEDGVLTLSLPKLSPDKIKAPRLVNVNVTPAAGGENHQQKKHEEL